MAGEAELRICNSMLALVGEGARTSLVDLHPSMVQMRTILENKDYDFQSRGWFFNREREFTIDPDVDGKLPLPDGTMSFKVTQRLLSRLSGLEKTRLVARGGFIYDTLAHTNVLDRTVVCDLVVRLDYDDLPPVALTYLGALAREQANMSDDGDMAKHNELKRETAAAWALLYSEELTTLAVNALQSPQAEQLRYQSSTGRNPNLIGG